MPLLNLIFDLDKHLRPNTNLSVPCPYCNVEEGDPCVTSGGRVKENSHRKRVVSLKIRSRIKVVEIVQEDAPLKAGERYFARSYGLDPEKGVLLHRITDWHDPSRNFYWRGGRVKPLGWVPSDVYDSFVKKLERVEDAVIEDAVSESFGRTIFL